ncbi:hypothetical protein BDW69DRAFT_188092 [Aspergillus filifer]
MLDLVLSFVYYTTQHQIFQQVLWILVKPGYITQSTFTKHKQPSTLSKEETQDITPDHKTTNGQRTTAKMVNWTAESTTRLVAALIAANPSIKLDYNATAAIFGQGATYDTIEYRFRTYRKMAEKLKAEAIKNGVSLDKIPRGRQGTGTPRTPRSQNRVAKTSSAASSGRGSKSGAGTKGLSTPTKSSRRGGGGGTTLLQPILVHSDEDENEDEAKDENDFCKIKTEMKTAGIIPSVEDSDIEGAAVHTQFREGMVMSVKEEDVFTTPTNACRSGPSRSHSRIVISPSEESDDDMCMGSDGNSPTPQRRGRTRDRSRSGTSRVRGTPLALKRSRAVEDYDEEEEMFA